ncbi:endonuclease domain-containing protein [Pseudoxanthomonas sacheonensis]|uniref:Very-short-patch-repair endonuclease n=1 Tax=Pseudoxanthomonas sacheonensis TaxID=443615 RepID=A0ABU1RS95_9GAMM|nr:DUF559 domain-containing protein [Pseudoxanthomonas sacheonensis]MDR6841656.1 very-short-patch-repair endonuclease [Pseudoxanthomonas sacheonensis]
MDTLRQRARKLRNSATDAEQRLWQHLRLKQLGGFKFRRQVPVKSYIADFLCHELKLVVELDGGQHVEQSAYDKQQITMCCCGLPVFLRIFCGSWN